MVCASVCEENSPALARGLAFRTHAKSYNNLHICNCMHLHFMNLLLYSCMYDKKLHTVYVSKINVLFCYVHCAVLQYQLQVQ